MLGVGFFPYLNKYAVKPTAVRPNSVKIRFFSRQSNYNIKTLHTSGTSITVLALRQMLVKIIQQLRQIIQL